VISLSLCFVDPIQSLAILMLHHILHALRGLWRERIALFWPIWIAITAMGVMLVLWVVPRHQAVPPDPDHSRRERWSRAGVLAVVFLVLFLGCYIAGSLVWEDFTYYDNSHFTNETLVGRNVGVQIAPEVGRMWPLGYQEFNLLRHFTHSVTGYHALHIIQLLLLCGILLVFDEELSIAARVALITLVLITPSMVISFSGLIYAEWNIIFLLACLAWSVKRFEQTRSTAWAITALLASQCMLYYKETNFVLLLGFAGGRLLLRCREPERQGWNFKRLRDPESRLDMCLAVLVVPFLLYYLAAMFPHFSTRYAEDFHLSLGQVLVSYLEVDLLAWILVAVVVARIFLILRRRIAPSLLWDGLALGGVSCFAAYLVLRMSSGYYLAPVDLVAILYIGRLAILSIPTMSRVSRLCALGLLLLVVLQDTSLSAFRMYERKNVIHAKAEMGHMIQARYRSDPQSVKRIFFPFARPFHILEFASYLNYLGVPVEQVQPGSAETGGVEMVGPQITKDGPCGYRTFVCHPGNSPEPGDLVVLLPDDLTRIDASNSYREVGTSPQFSYNPRPSIPGWLEPYVNHLHVISPIFAHAQLPDSWLTASVTAWQ
jgi:hypothetical protein